MALLKADVKPLSLKVRVNGSSKLILILNKPEIQLWWSFMLKKDPVSAAALKVSSPSPQKVKNSTPMV